MTLSNELRIRLKTLPRQPGVYQMLAENGSILYVGKAKDLSKRVRTYFNREHEDIKTRRLVEKIADVRWLVTDNELEALMLETNLIKKHRPRYNVLMKDDKNYVYIKVSAEEFPRVYIVRQVLKDGGRYFGPYSNGLVVKNVLRSLNRIFPFFTYQTKIGVAPMESVAGRELFAKRSLSAWGYLTDKVAYQTMINDFLSFLRGNRTVVVRNLQEQMKQAAAHKEFERAAKLRDRLSEVKNVTEQQKVISPTQSDVDVIGFFGEEKKWVASVLLIREGKLLDVRNYSLQDGLVNGLAEHFVTDYYSRVFDWPKEIYLPAFGSQSKIIEEYLQRLSGKKIKLVSPQKGKKAQLVSLAEKNAKLDWFRRAAVVNFARQETEGLVELLPHLAKEGWLGYDIFPNWLIKNKPEFRIEAYDISNLGETGVVGGMVVWEAKEKVIRNKEQVISKKTEDRRRKTEKMEINDIKDLLKWRGGFAKQYYRRFAIREFSGQDDFAAMREVLSRRFGKLRPGWGGLPDLILIDGGKGQLSVVKQVLLTLGIDIPVIGLAKKEEEIWLVKPEETRLDFASIKLDQNDISSLLLQGIRDEVHRYTISYQRLKRKKVVRESVLDRIAGLGPKQKKKLLAKFGSVAAVKEAGQEKVAELVGAKLAVKIFELI